MAKRDMITPPNNSFKYKEKVKSREEVKEPPEIIQDAVMETKKTLGKKLAETFISEDAHSVTSYIFSDVIVPMLKDMIFGAINQGSEAMIYGLGGGRKPAGRRSSSRNYTSASYQDYYSGSARSEARPEVVKLDTSELSFKTRAIALDILEDMKAVIEQYDNISISGYHEIVERRTGYCPSGSYTDYNYGWTDLSKVTTQIIKGGRYVLTLPPPEPIRRV